MLVSTVNTELGHNLSIIEKKNIEIYLFSIEVLGEKKGKINCAVSEETAQCYELTCVVQQSQYDLILLFISIDIVILKYLEACKPGF